MANMSHESFALLTCVLLCSCIRLIEARARIVGGSNVVAQSYPWFVKFNGCGGFLISPEFVLTAAHCEPVASGHVTIGALCTGVTSTNCGQEEEVRTVMETIIHPDFDEDNLDKDFLLVQLTERSTITPVDIDDGSYSPNYTKQTKLWAIGFGVLYYGGTFTPSNLQHVELNYVEQHLCDNIYESYGGVTDSMMCAGEYGKDSCQGDSGGPLYDKINGIVVGITSFGAGCGSDHPGIWARIASEYDWIMSTMCANHSIPKPSTCNGYTLEPTKSPAPTSSPSQNLHPTIPPEEVVNCDEGSMKYRLELKTDRYGHETTWTLMENSTLAIMHTDSHLENFKEYIYEFCLPCSNYELEILDSYGDGILEPGGYEFFIDNIQVSKYTQKTDGGFTSKKIDIPQASHCPPKEPCAEGEIAFDLSHYGLHSGSSIRWAIEDVLTGKFVQNRTDLVAHRLNQVRVCLRCSKYIFMAWNDKSYGATGGLSVSVNENVLEQYNLLLDNGMLSSSIFTAPECPSYYIIKSEKKHNGFDYCLEPKNANRNALVVIRKCDKHPNQLWRPDEYGQFHAYGNDELCAAKKLNKVRLRHCTNGRFLKSRSKNMAYSQFTKQIIWMKDGRKSLSTNVHRKQGNEVFFKFFTSSSDKNQLWTIEEI